MALKPSYVIDGRSWMPLSRAAALLGTNTAGVKRLMGSGDLDWCQLRAGSSTFVVDEAAVFALRLARGTAAKQRDRRNGAATDTAQRRNRSMLATLPVAREKAAGSVFDLSWDPSPVELPISGREATPKSKS